MTPEQAFIDSLFHGEITLNQAELDSLTQVLLNNPVANSQVSCEDLRFLRSAIAFGCAMGSRSEYLAELLELNEDCLPNNGSYHFAIATIHFERGNLPLAIEFFELALSQLGKQHPLSINTAFNLAASHHETGNLEKAINLMTELLAPESEWHTHPSMGSVEYKDMLRVNAAAMMMSNRQFFEALEMLSMVQRSELPTYWKRIHDFNQFLAFNEIAQFELADSTWLASIQFVPVLELPEKLMRRSLESAMMLNRIDYAVNMLSELKASETAEALFGIPFFSSLLIRDWTVNELEESSKILGNYIREIREEEQEKMLHVRQNQADLNDDLQTIRQNLALATQRSQDWKWIALVLLLALILATGAWGLKERRKHRKIASALEEMGKQPEGFKADQGLEAEELRTLQDAITKGNQVGKALLVVKKLQAFTTTTDQSDTLEKLGTIPGYDTLTPLEHRILELAAKNLSTKDMAHHLSLSQGHINNARSALRSKLNIPPSTHLATWIAMKSTKTTDGDD